ncbi:MAG: toll/interleukin-1 receptor domain-containing protein [Nitrospira sp.]
MPKPVIFISHVHEDADLGAALKALLDDAFTGSIDVFLSSDPSAVPPGELWREKIRANLRCATDFIILLTPRSLGRPWVNFEAGAACGRGIRFIPVCAKHLPLDLVGPPLGDPQMVTLDTTEHVDRLVTAIATPYDYTPKPDHSKVAAVIQCAMSRYGNLPPPLTPTEKQNEPMHLHKMREEFDGLTEPRRVFWETLESFYACNFSAKAGYPSTLAALVDLVGPPRGVPLAQGEKLLDYPTKHRRLMTGSDPLLYDFCTLIYPPSQPGKDLVACTGLGKDAFERFHTESRGRLAKFWNRWGQTAYEGHILGVDTIFRSFDAHVRLLKILSYLEIALVQWTQDTTLGKEWLFRLTRDWPSTFSK